MLRGLEHLSCEDRAGVVQPKQAEQPKCEAILAAGQGRRTAGSAEVRDCLVHIFQPGRSDF